MALLFIDCKCDESLIDSHFDISTMICEAAKKGTENVN